MSLVELSPETYFRRPDFCYPTQRSSVSTLGPPRVAIVAKVILLDGNSLTYRAFFALPTDMTTASGQVTNAVFGFTSMLLTLIKDQKPDGVVVVHDFKGTKEEGGRWYYQGILHYYDIIDFGDSLVVLKPKV